MESALRNRAKSWDHSSTILFGNLCGIMQDAKGGRPASSSGSSLGSCKGLVRYSPIIGGFLGPLRWGFLAKVCKSTWGIWTTNSGFFSATSCGRSVGQTGESLVGSGQLPEAVLNDCLPGGDHAKCWHGRVNFLVESLGGSTKCVGGY